MKNLFFFFFFFGLVSAYGQMQIGGKLAYGTEIESFGLGAKANFPLDSRFSLSPEFVYFFEDDNLSLFELNGDIHYALSANWDGFSPYLLGGLNYVDFDDDNSFRGDPDSEWGLNLGFGAGYKLSDKVDFISEIKYVLSDFDQLVFSIGFLVDL